MNHLASASPFSDKKFQTKQKIYLYFCLSKKPTPDQTKPNQTKSKQTNKPTNQRRLFPVGVTIERIPSKVRNVFWNIFSMRKYYF